MNNKQNLIRNGRIRPISPATQEQITDLLVDALEYGAAYWAKPENYLLKYPSLSAAVFGGGEIQVFDLETDELLGVVNQRNIMEALQMMADGQDRNGGYVSRRHFQDFVLECGDAITADVFLQLAVMGEVRFG